MPPPNPLETAVLKTLSEEHPNASAEMLATLLNRYFHRDRISAKSKDALEREFIAAGLKDNGIQEGSCGCNCVQCDNGAHCYNKSKLCKWSP